MGVPDDRLTYRTKGELALAEVDRLRAAGLTFGCVLADAGYGSSAAFRQALSARGLTWAVGIPRIQKVYPLEVALRTVPGVPTKFGGRPRVHPVPTHRSGPAERVLAAARWRTLAWRTGTKGALRARFAAVRVVVADGPLSARAPHLPGEAAWLVGEKRTTGERKYYLTSHPPTATLRQLVAAIKARWSCEQAHQQLKEELGLDHFEGRTWLGLHHHALMTMISFAFLQHLRLRTVRRRLPRRRGENPASPPRAAPPADAADDSCDAAHPPHATNGGPPPMPDVSRAADVSAARVDLAK